jgi:alkylation response protein AidB-like acyl-CoA dehydrogenase
MNLDSNETETLLRDGIRSFLERAAPFDRIRELEAAGSWDDTLWAEVCAQGWIGLPFGEARGGSGGSLVDVGILVEQFARRAAIVPVAEVLASAWVLERHAGGGVGRELCEGLMSGAFRVVPAVPGTRAAELLRVDGGRLRGEVPVVDYGQQATHHLVLADVEGSTALYLVDASQAEIVSVPLVSIGRTPACAVRYDAAAVTPVCGADGAAELVRFARSLAAVQCVGSMAEAFDRTVAYAKFREQFGKPIGAFQAVRHHCANMAMRVESARFLAFEALSAIEAGRATDRQVALAKASASRAVPEVTMLAHQIHGGNGVIEENDLYFFTLRGKERSLAWGSAEECLAIAAETIDVPHEWL